MPLINLPDYNKVTYANDSTNPPINSTNLNKNETQTELLTNAAKELQTVVEEIQESIVSDTVDILITPTDWVDGIYTFTDPRITADNFWEIMNAKDSEYSDEQWEEALALRLVLVSQTDGEMKIRNRTEEMPTLSLPMMMKYLGGV